MTFSPWQWLQEHGWEWNPRMPDRFRRTSNEAQKIVGEGKTFTTVDGKAYTIPWDHWQIHAMLVQDIASEADMVRFMYQFSYQEFRATQAACRAMLEPQ